MLVFQQTGLSSHMDDHRYLVLRDDQVPLKWRKVGPGELEPSPTARNNNNCNNRAKVTVITRERGVF